MRYTSVATYPSTKNLRVLSATQNPPVTECDYEYWQLFGNSDQAVAYVIQLMGTISSFYERDAQVKWHLPFIRIWTTDDCPFDSNITTVALEELSTYWKANMSNVNRDLVHMLSGKLGRKGRSWGDLCDYQCSDGTFMSYCWGCPGGLSNQLLNFHPRVVQVIRATMSCLPYGLNPVYVDWKNTGSEDGTISHPFDTAVEGVQAVIPGGTVYIAPGSYPESFIANRPMTLMAYGGTVTIIGQ
jgi:hypothetical protein